MKNPYLNPYLKYIVTAILCFNVLTWNLAYAANNPEIFKNSGDQITNVEKEKEAKGEKQLWPLIILAVIVIVVASSICYTIVKCADNAALPHTNGLPRRLDPERLNAAWAALNKDKNLTYVTQIGVDPNKKHYVFIEKTYNNGATWLSFTNIYTYPYHWEVRDYTPITNGLRPNYRAYIVQ